MEKRENGIIYANGLLLIREHVVWFVKRVRDYHG